MFLYLRIVYTAYDIHAVGHDEYALVFDRINRGSNTDIVTSDVGECHSTDSNRYAFHLPDDWSEEKIKRFGEAIQAAVYEYCRQNKMPSERHSSLAGAMEMVMDCSYRDLYKKFLLEGLEDL